MSEISARHHLHVLLGGLVLAGVLLCAVSGIVAGQQGGNPTTTEEPTEAAPPEPTLSPEQEAVAQRIFNELISPCCWTTTVAQHGSGAAPRIQAEVRVMLAQGKNHDQIIEHYVEQFGERILAEPAKKGFNLAAYVVPYLALALGAVAVVMVFRRNRYRRGLSSAAAPTASGQTPASKPDAPGPASADDYRKRIEEELKRTS